LKSAGSQANFVSTKMQSNDLSVATTDRLPVGGNRSGDPVRLFSTAPAARLRRKRKRELRQVMDAILWLLRTGCQWRNLPHYWPHWQAVYYYFDRWKKAGLFEQINARLNQLDRQQQGRNINPSAFCIDSQSIKLAPMGGEFRGLDPNKRVNAGPPVRP
jgi:transposase